MFHLYTSILPIPLIPSTMIGFFIGFPYGMQQKNPTEMFCNCIGYTSIGIITGIAYPVSFPLLAGYVLYKS